MNKTITKQITRTAIFVALGLLMPQIFHFAGGQAMGKMMLPMHIPVLLCGFVLGPIQGLVCGLLVPLLSSLIFGMPPAFPTLPLMMVELPLYGVFAGLFYRKFKIDINISLIISMIIGRIGYAVCFYFMLQIGLKVPEGASMFAAFTSGIMGIALQLAVLPILVNALKKRDII